MTPIRTILYPSDFSDLAEPALDIATALARGHGARIIICHVLPAAMKAALAGQDVGVAQSSIHAARERLEVIQPVDPAIVVEHRLVFGDEAEEIVRLAVECPADVIVMGTHGRTGLSRLLAGSVAETVLRNAPCPVLTVRLPKHHSSYS